MENTARLINSSKETGEPTTTGPWKNAFPVQLHCLLSEAESDGMAHIASFCVHGRAFQIHKLDLFVENILPWSVSPSSTFLKLTAPSNTRFMVLSSWFRQSKYTSFQRQLNIYGFQRIIGEYSGCDNSSTVVEVASFDSVLLTLLHG
jgi:HSF-type DNA-binding